MQVFLFIKLKLVISFSMFIYNLNSYKNLASACRNPNKQAVNTDYQPYTVQRASLKNPAVF